MVLLTAYIKTFSVYADNILSDFVVAVVIICMNIFIINGEYQRNIQEQKCEYLINLATVRFSPLTYNTDFQTGSDQQIWFSPLYFFREVLSSFILYICTLIISEVSVKYSLFSDGKHNYE